MESKKLITNINWRKIFGRYGIYLVFILLCLIMSIISPVFLTLNNILNVLRQVSLIGITAIGVTFVILAAEIDLSLGSVAGLTGVLAVGFTTGLYTSSLGLALSVAIALFAAFIIGITMGLIITKGKVHSFVVTLGMLTIARGLTLIYTRGTPLSGLSDNFRFLGGGRILVIPIPIIFFIFVALIAYVILTKTPFGVYIYAIGGNREVTRLSGINIDLVRIISFGISSLLAGFAGILLAARINVGTPIAGVGWELDAIAAAIIGGTSLYGGKGGVGATVIGALFVGVLRNGLNLLNISAYYQQVFIGVFIIIAVIIDSIREEN